MPIYNLFSKRNSPEKHPGVFQSTELSEKFRGQVTHILMDLIGDVRSYLSGDIQELYGKIYNVLCREYGVIYLNSLATQGNYGAALLSFFSICSNEEALDVIEVSFQILVYVYNQGQSYRLAGSSKINLTQAIDELNSRFLEHSIGYQFDLSANRIICIDSTFTYAEVIRPTLSLLSSKTYSVVNDEFLKAHEHYRYGRYEECLNACLKAYESTLKVVCDKRKWIYGEKDTAKPLLDKCFENGLFPSYLTTYFTGVRATLESGIPVLRNKLSGHGSVEKTKVHQYFASYALNMTASAILFIVGAEENLPSTTTGGPA